MSFFLQVFNAPTRKASPESAQGQADRRSPKRRAGGWALHGLTGRANGFWSCLPVQAAKPEPPTEETRAKRRESLPRALRECEPDEDRASPRERQGWAGVCRARAQHGFCFCAVPVAKAFPCTMPEYKKRLVLNKSSLFVPAGSEGVLSFCLDCLPVSRAQTPRNFFGGTRSGGYFKSICLQVNARHQVNGKPNN